MLFTQARLHCFGLFKNTNTNTLFVRGTGTRKCLSTGPSATAKSSASTSASASGPSSESSSVVPSILVVGTTFGGYLAANYISNCMCHPAQKLDYGVMNQFMFLDPRPVNSPYWGTRLPHLFLVPATLTVFDFASLAIFAKYFGYVSFAASPASWLVRLYVYTWLGVGSYFVYDSSLNPAHENNRMENLVSLIKPLTIGMGLQWHAEIMANMLNATGAGVLAFLRMSVAKSLVFFPVKALGFGDFHFGGLSAYEKEMNGIPEEKSEDKKK